MNILIVDDDEDLGTELASFIAMHGHSSECAACLDEARKVLSVKDIDLAIVDLFLGGESGMSILGEILPVPVIVVSGKGGVAEAVEAIKAGAYDFLEKPIDPDRLIGLFRNIEKELDSERKITALRSSWLSEHAAFAPGSPFETVIEQSREAAASPLSILLGGPSGSGKEVIARWIHHCSARASKPFIAVNCAAVQSDLAESLFFGVRKGSFTGADSDRPGWFQAADGGTLFMDELGDIPPPVQAKLLRAAESGEVQRLGSVAMEHVDIRIISATGKDLEAEMKAGRFRADFYFRLAQVSIRIPPLDERRCDIGPLANFFLDRLRGGAILEPPAISTDGLAWLMTRSWPGNARELRAFIERAAWHGAGTVLDSSFFKTLVSGTTAPGQRPLLPVLTSAQIPGTRMPLKEARIAFERSYVIKVLAESGGSVTQAAAALGILPNNLSRKMKELGISPE